MENQHTNGLVVAVDVDRLRESGDPIQVVALALHWTPRAKKEEKERFHYVVKIRVDTPDGSVTREYHNRFGSWMTDRTEGDQWPENVVMKEGPEVAWTMQTLLGRRNAAEPVARAKKEAMHRERGWKWPTKSERRKANRRDVRANRHGAPRRSRTSVQTAAAAA